MDGKGMIIGQKGVKYGLTIHSSKVKNPPRKPQKASLFGGEDDSDEDHDTVEHQIARHQTRKLEDKKVAAIQAAALAEDASIFEYDAHYDTIQESRDAPKHEEKLQRQSKYIAGLLEKAEERKREQDVLYEKQLLKEREAEDRLYGTTEQFVTAAYKKKLEEDRRIMEQQKKKQAEEEANAVEKKGHMGDFYRNLLRNNVAFGTSSGPAASSAAPNKERLVSEGTAATSLPPEGTPDGGERELRGGPVPEVSEPRRSPGTDVHVTEPAQRDGTRVSSTPPPTLDATTHEQAVWPARGTEGQVPPQQDDRQGGAPPQSSPEHRSSILPVTAPAKPNRDDAVAAARERYLARKRKVSGT